MTLVQYHGKSGKKSRLTSIYSHVSAKLGASYEFKATPTALLLTVMRFARRYKTNYSVKAAPREIANTGLPAVNNATPIEAIVKIPSF